MISPSIRAAALRELRRDHLYDRLTDGYRQELVDAALQLGLDAAVGRTDRPATVLAVELGVAVERVDDGALSIRAEYDATGPLIRLYLPTLYSLAAAKGLPPYVVVETALAHELFHHLEPSLSMDRLPAFTLWHLGPIRRLVVPLRAREIAAHAFAMAVAGLSFFPTELDEM